MVTTARSAGLAVALLLFAIPAVALHPSGHAGSVVIPAAVRTSGEVGSFWVTDLTLHNPTGSANFVTVHWLERDSANALGGSGLVLDPDETRTIEDVVGELFGFDSAAGALIVSSEWGIVATSVIRNTGGEAEYGQGFEGLPVSTAHPAGTTTTVPGVVETGRYRTNFFLVDMAIPSGEGLYAGSTGSTAVVRVLDPDGLSVAEEIYHLGQFEPILKPLDLLIDGELPLGSLEIEVIRGKVLAGASRVDNRSGDPITLEAVWPLGWCRLEEGWYIGSVETALPSALFVEVVRTETGLALATLGGTLVLTEDDSGDPGCSLATGWRHDFDPAVPFVDGELLTRFDVQVGDEEIDVDIDGRLVAGTLGGQVRLSGPAGHPCELAGTVTGWDAAPAPDVTNPLHWIE